MPGSAHSQYNGPPQLVSVTPYRLGDVLVCRLQTLGLPGNKQLQSMRSGLVSAVDMDLALLGENGQILGGHSLSFKLAFDLWDEIFSVRNQDSEIRFSSLKEMQEYLADLVELPVIGIDRLDSDGQYRLQVEMVVHSIAPDEHERVEDVIAGNNRSTLEGGDGQEASVSMGRLIRFFYKGGGRNSGGPLLHSAWFRGKDMSDETN